MTYSQIIAYIQQWIYDNMNKEITAQIVRDVLEKIVRFIDDRTGDTSDLFNGDDLTEAINLLNQDIQNINLEFPLKVFEGTENPNINPPSNYNAPDFYVRKNVDIKETYIYTGDEWVRIGIEGINISDFLRYNESATIIEPWEFEHPLKVSDAIDDEDAINKGQLDEAMEGIDGKNIYNSDGKIEETRNVTLEEDGKLFITSEDAAVNVNKDVAGLIGGDSEVAAGRITGVPISYDGVLLRDKKLRIKIDDEQDPDGFKVAEISYDNVRQLVLRMQGKSSSNTDFAQEFQNRSGVIALLDDIENVDVNEIADFIIEDGKVKIVLEDNTEFSIDKDDFVQLLELGDLATKDTVGTDDIEDDSVTPDKLDRTYVEEGDEGDKNVQSDLAETDEDSDAFVKNKGKLATKDKVGEGEIEDEAVTSDKLDKEYAEKEYVDENFGNSISFSDGKLSLKDKNDNKLKEVDLSSLSAGNLQIEIDDSDPNNIEIVFKQDGQEVGRIEASDLLSGVPVSGNRNGDKLEFFDVSNNKVFDIELDLLKLGTTEDDAYRGDRGKIAYDHSQEIGTNPHEVTKSDVGLGNVKNKEQLGKDETAKDSYKLGGKDATDYALEADIPTKTSQLENDGDGEYPFLTENTVGTPSLDDVVREGNITDEVAIFQKGANLGRTFKYSTGGIDFSDGILIKTNIRCSAYDYFKINISFRHTGNVNADNISISAYNDSRSDGSLLGGIKNINAFADAAHTEIHMYFVDSAFLHIWIPTIDNASKTGFIDVSLVSKYTNRKITEIVNSGIYDESEIEYLEIVTPKIRSTQDWVEDQNYLTEHQSLSNYYTKSQSLDLFVTQEGVQTIYDTKTFDSSPIVPKPTIDGHAVNKKWVEDQGYIKEQATIIEPWEFEHPLKVGDAVDDEDAINKGQLDEALEGIDGKNIYNSDGKITETRNVTLEEDGKLFITSEDAAVNLDKDVAGLIGGDSEVAVGSITGVPISYDGVIIRDKKLRIKIEDEQDSEGFKIAEISYDNVRQLILKMQGKSSSNTDFVQEFQNRSGVIALLSDLEGQPFGLEDVAQQAYTDKAIYVIPFDNQSRGMQYQEGSIDLGYTVDSTHTMGLYAIRFGLDTQASGLGSSAFGNSSIASGQYSSAFGEGAEATGYASTAFGLATEASEEGASAFGRETKASGYASTAFGRETKASGQYSSAFGEGAEATGYASTAFGLATEAKSFAEIALGSYNDSPSPNSSTLHDVNDIALSLGIGSSNSNRSNGLEVWKDGRVIAPELSNSKIDDADDKVLVTKEWVLEQINSL